MIRRLVIALPVVPLLCAFGCNAARSAPELASAAYPTALHRAESIDIQVLRTDTEIELINATAHSFAEFDLWLNQRYVKQIPSLPAGESIQLSLWGFHDERGETFNAGGFWRTEAATPLWLAEIQTAPDTPMIGLVTIAGED